MTHTRIELIRKGMLEPSPFRLDELKAYEQGRKARLCLQIYVLTVVLGTVATCGWIYLENQPAVKLEASASIQGAGR